MVKRHSAGGPDTPPGRPAPSGPAPRPPFGPPSGRAGPASPARLSASERRDAILRAALPLFAVRGFEGTTTRELAGGAGVTEPILYRHFPGKADLFAAVLAGAADRVQGSLEASIEGVSTAPARLQALADDLESLLSTHEDDFRVLNGAAAVHGSEETVAQVRAAYARLGRFLSKALDAPGLRRGVSPETAGHLLLEVGLGAALVRPLGLAAVKRAGYGIEAMKLLLSAVAAPGKG